MLEFSSHPRLRRMEVRFNPREPWEEVPAETTQRSLHRGLYQAREDTAAKSPLGSTGHRPHPCPGSFEWVVLTEQLCSDHRAVPQWPLLITRLTPPHGQSPRAQLFCAQVTVSIHTSIVWFPNIVSCRAAHDYYSVFKCQLGSCSMGFGNMLIND